MVTAIIAAAGSGKRMNKGINKAFIPLLNRPVVAHSILAIASCREVNNLLVVVAPGEEPLMQTIIGELKFEKSWKIVTGGSERQYSVANALAELPTATEIVLVHDGARPLIDEATINEAIAAARSCGAACVAVPVKDTIKVVDAGGFVDSTPDRNTLWAIQTPQVFKRSILEQAYDTAAQEGVVATDDSALVERLGIKVKIVKGDYRNLKVTTPEDITVAEALMGKGTESVLRFGIGYDVHKLVTGRKLIIGGVDIPYEFGLEGHSDADVLLHAIKDALLGAAALGDIGKHFPDTDARYKGASSLMLLAEVGRLIADKGWRTNNIDAIIIAERPKMAPYVSAMVANIAKVLDVGSEQVNIKATTTEGLGFTGRREGIAAQAVASIVRAT